MAAKSSSGGAGKMEFLLILTGPLWPLALLVGIDRLRDLPVSVQRKPALKAPETSEAFEEDGVLRAQPAAPPKFVVPPAC